MDYVNSYQLNIRNDAIKFFSSTPGLSTINSALEIGGGGGYTLATLKRLLSIEDCVNVDISLPNKLSPEISHYEANIISPSFNLDRSSLILLSHWTCEHIVDTSLVLSRFYSLGSQTLFFYFLYPIYNIIHLPLMFRDTFPTNDSGVFDRTHMRWFTFADFARVLGKMDSVIRFHILTTE